MTTLAALKKDVRAAANPAKAAFLAGFFRTDKGEYGEGDVFLGITVPQSRIIARRYAELPLMDIRRLLAARFHEERLIALLLLVRRYEVGDAAERKRVCAFYLANAERANNWDLVDASAYKILGAELARGSARQADAVLGKLARSRNVWRRRIAMVATYAFIRAGRLEETFRVADALLHDEHDLIHKAAGWMLREAGKRNHAALVRWLKPRCARMPRTMLRYAIERFPEAERKRFLAAG